MKIAWRTLAGPLRAPERQRIRVVARRLLSWQRDLSGWSVPSGVPDATPFVALYVRGRLRGCYGSDEGAPGERLARAFLRALSDARFGGIAAADRAEVVAEVSYVRKVRACGFERLMTDVEPGTHGVGLLATTGGPVLLLPSVARDDGLTAHDLIVALARKAGLPDEPSLAALPTFSFETSTVVCRPDGSRPRAGRAIDLAAKWLARLVDDDGQVLFALDGRTGAAERVGPMHHGRAAAAIRALARHGGHAREVARGRERLARDVRRALAGKSVAGWPTDPAQVAATAALAALAGAPLQAEVAELVRHTPNLERVPWHAAQVVAALGRTAPPSLWQACVESLEREPWAPWTVLAARAYGDMAAVERAERALVGSVRRRAPYAGGVSLPSSTGVPEVALTALTAEVLASSQGRQARAAVGRARDFLRRWQMTAEGPACASPAAFGAFPATPVSMLLRCDMTGHALMALC